MRLPAATAALARARTTAARFPLALASGAAAPVALMAQIEYHQLPFWQFNRILFLGYLLAALYAVVLWVGLAIALLAIDKLLGVDVPSRTYPHLLVLLAFVFHPWFFLSRVPEDHRALDQETSYPLGLKVFTQFVLIPLVAVYLVILTVYLGRVLVTRTWPSGWIGWCRACRWWACWPCCWCTRSGSGRTAAG